MQITYNPQNPSGKQYGVMLPDGRHADHLSRADVEALLRRDGIAYSDGQSLIAAARLAAMCPA